MIDSASDDARSTRGRHRSGRLGLFLVLIGLVTAGALAGLPSIGQADDGPGFAASPEEQKANWQERYRTLRQRSARLRRDAAIEWELYADANRRNYRRGQVRHVHRNKAIEIEVELAEVEEELRALPERARRSGALPGWLREVEFEAIVIPPPESESVPSAPAQVDDERAGRNPIHFEDDEDEVDEAEPAP